MAAGILRGTSSPPFHQYPNLSLRDGKIKAGAKFAPAIMFWIWFV